ncbi:hypothetical protein BT69DRAFT_1323521 [Atractiella rhizophila]|nr:hypothetical protein BT69DRAFT_1323521 [Atractiella rhizophila]
MTNEPFWTRSHINMHLLDLPSELVTSILRHLCMDINIDTSDLLQLRLTSRAISHCLEPLLFRRPFLFTSSSAAYLLAQPTKIQWLRSLDWGEAGTPEDNLLELAQAFKAVVNQALNLIALAFTWGDAHRYGQEFTFPPHLEDRLASLSLVLVIDRARGTQPNVEDYVTNLPSLRALCRLSLGDFEVFPSSIDDDQVIGVPDNAALISSLNFLCIYEMGIAPCLFKNFFRNSLHTLRFLAVNEVAFKVHSDASNLIIACSAQLESLSFYFTFTRTALPPLPKIRFLRLVFKFSVENLGEPQPNFGLFVPTLLESKNLVELHLTCFNFSSSTSWIPSKAELLHIRSLFVGGVRGDFPTFLKRILAPACVKHLVCQFNEQSGEIIDVVKDGLKQLAMFDYVNCFDNIAQCESLFSFISSVIWWTSLDFTRTFTLPFKQLIIHAGTPFDFVPLASIITKTCLPNLERVYLLCRETHKEDLDEFFRMLPELYYALSLDPVILSKWEKDVADILDVPERVQMGMYRDAIEFTAGF